MTKKIPEPPSLTFAEFFQQTAKPQSIKDIVRTAVDVIEAKQGESSYSDVCDLLDDLETAVHEFRKAGLNRDWWLGED